MPPSPTLYDPSVGRPDIRSGLESLPLRAVVAFAFRCAQRVEPLRRLAASLPAVYSAGLDVYPYPRGGTAALMAAGNAVSAAVSAVERFVGNAYDAAREAAGDACQAASHVAGDGAVLRAADLDLMKLHLLGLGEPSSPGEPVRWDDPRLGPLWPDGPPDWYVEADALSREREDLLRQLAEPAPVPPGEALAARLDLRDRLDARAQAGEFREYGGGYIVTDGDTVYAHGRNLLRARERAEEKARAKGVPADRLVDYFVPAGD